MSLIGVKKGFTLIELVIVILIISIVYLLIFSNNSFNIKNQEEKITLYNLKDFLLKNFEFEKELSFLCIEKDFSCYVKTDGKIVEDFKINHFFIKIPDIYEYNIEERRVNFKDLRIEDFDYKVVFELKINSDYKTNEFILDTLENKVYVFNSIFTRPKLYETLNESFEAFNLSQIEVKDAF